MLMRSLLLCIFGILASALAANEDVATTTIDYDQVIESAYAGRNSEIDKDIAKWELENKDKQPELDISIKSKALLISEELKEGASPRKVEILDAFIAFVEKIAPKDLRIFIFDVQGKIFNAIFRRKREVHPQDASSEETEATANEDVDTTTNTSVLIEERANSPLDEASQWELENKDELAEVDAYLKPMVIEMAEGVKVGASARKAEIMDAFIALVKKISPTDIPMFIDDLQSKIFRAAYRNKREVHLQDFFSEETEEGTTLEPKTEITTDEASSTEDDSLFTTSSQGRHKTTFEPHQKPSTTKTL